MNKTKRKILDKSLEMFNLNGVKETTLRMISKELGISQGNLNYHFQTKDEIIEVLYFELVEKIDSKMQSIIQTQPVLNLLYESSYRSMECFFEYKFLMKDLHKILLSNTKLRTHYNGLQIVRKNQFMQLFDILISTGTIREAAFKNEYERFYERMNILGDNWINTSDLLYNSTESPVKHYANLLFEIIYPYLTEKGREEYEKISFIG